MNDLARVTIDADRPLGLAILARRRQPDLLTKNDRRRPAAIVKGRLPDDVGGVAPGRRQIPGRGQALASRSAELRPGILGSPQRNINSVVNVSSMRMVDLGAGV